MRLSANPSSATSIQLTWSQPAELNGILHNYRIRYKLSSDLNFGAPISAGKQSAYNVTGLTPFTNYELQVHQFSFESPLCVVNWRVLIFCVTF